jgi:hypothetical protein
LLRELKTVAKDIEILKISKKFEDQGPGNTEIAQWSNDKRNFVERMMVV